MTTDLRSALERARDLAPASPPDLEALAGARGRRERRRRVGAMTLSLVVGLLVIAGAFAAVRSRPGVAGPAAGGGDFPTPGGLAMPDGSYLYLHVTAFDGSGGPSTSSWWAQDGSGRLMLTTGEDTTYGPGQLPTDSGPLDGLSLDASVLREQMLQRMSPDGASPEPFDQFSPGPGQPDHTTAGLIRSIGELLADANSTPQLRAALFRVAAGLDGVDVTRDATDPAGRAAIELSVTTEGSLHRWWFDPSSQQLLAAQDEGGPVTVVEAEAFTPGTTPRHAIAQLIPAPVHDPR
jgi:hypothetical protein